MLLILFDIDGTLIDSGGAGMRSLASAFKEIFSVDDAFHDIPMAGRTDLEIISDALERRGLATGDGVLPAFVDAYLKYLSSEIDNSKRCLMPGVKSLLDVLQAKENYAVGLLTGNLEQGARIKLEPFGLNRYFSFGAYGSDHMDRNKLLPIAIERFAAISGVSAEFSKCVIVGDTPKDVECAKPYGAYTVAVATGKYTSTDLGEAGAHLVLENLADREAFLNFIQQM